MTPRIADSSRKMLNINRTVTVLRDTTLQFPELFMEVYVEGEELRAFAEMFISARCTKAESAETADLVVFTGGSDVNPEYYGEDCHPRTHFHPARDDADVKLYKTCLENGIPMFGVCRGAQFLHVMNGGKLYQDVDNHVGDHAIFDIRKKIHIPKVSSVHHQMVIPDRTLGMEIIADTHQATVRELNKTKKITGKMSDVEAFFYPDTCCFGVQGHPEYRGYYHFRQWCLEMIDELICQNPDVEVRGRFRRLKQDIMAQRDAMQAEKRKELT